MARQVGPLPMRLPGFLAGVGHDPIRTMRMTWLARVSLVTAREFNGHRSIAHGHNSLIQQRRNVPRGHRRPPISGERGRERRDVAEVLVVLFPHSTWRRLRAARRGR